MNIPVHFYGYCFFAAIEIKDELVYRVLTPEFPPVQPAGAERIPKYPFWDCSFFSEGSGVLYGGRKGTEMLFHLNIPLDMRGFYLIIFYSSPPASLSLIP